MKQSPWLRFLVVILAAFLPMLILIGSSVFSGCTPKQVIEPEPVHPGAAYGIPPEVWDLLEPGTIIGGFKVQMPALGLPPEIRAVLEGHDRAAGEIEVAPFQGYMLSQGVEKEMVRLDMDACPDSLWPSPSGCCRWLIIFDNQGNPWHFYQRASDGKIVGAMSNGTMWLPTWSPSYRNNR